MTYYKNDLTRTKAQWAIFNERETPHNLHIFGIVILNTKCKDCKSRKNLCTKNFPYTKKFYLHEIAVVDLSKIYFLKTAKKSCKPKNRDLNRDWKKALGADPRSIQQIVFQGVVGGTDDTKIRLHYSWTIKRDSLTILQRSTKSFVRIYKWLNTIK